jgi:hypothetical protein
VQYIEYAALRKVLGHDEAVVVLDARAEALKHLARAQYAQKCHLVKHLLHAPKTQHHKSVLYLWTRARTRHFDDEEKEEWRASNAPVC